MAFVSQGTKIREVSAGGKHSLFLALDGSVYSSGSNDFGQLGYESEGSVDLPRKVPVLKCTQVCSGLVHSQVLTAGGQVFSFGDN